LKSGNSNYIPTLDGWRAIAILLVLFDHGSFFTFRPLGWTRVGGYGVEIFFVLSGYLITGKLIEDGSLRKFYLRRVFRILPVVFAYLAVIVVLGFVFRLIPVAWSEIVASLLFVRNYLYFPSMARNWFTIQLWSLSVEEQFYLVWPLVLLKVGKGIPRRQFFAAALLFAMGCGVIVLVHIGRLFHLGGLHWMPYIKFGGLVVGCMLRIAFSEPRTTAIIRKIFFRRSLGVVAALFAYIVAFHAQLTMFDPLICGLAVCATLVEPNAMFGRFLEFSALRWIGRLSYSLYIWQQLFLCFALVYRPFGVFSTFPLNFVSLLAVACASYYLMERPLTRLGHTLTRQNSPPHSDSTVFPLTTTPNEIPEAAAS
jgi:peptidoglycan/LPS O-acetylase OafA/YrhL